MVFRLLLIYPKESGLMLISLLLASVSEGFSATAILPLLIVIDQGDALAQEDGLTAQFFAFLESLGIDATLGNLVLIIMLGISVKSILILFTNRQIAFIGAQIQTDFRVEFLKALLHSRWSYFLTKSSGGLVNVMSTEITRSSACYIQLMGSISLAITAVIYMGIAVTISWKATLIATVLAMLIWKVLSKISRLARRSGKAQIKIYQSLMSGLSDAVYSIKIFKAMAREEFVLSVAKKRAHQLQSALKLEGFSNAALNSAQQFLFVSVIVGGIYFVSTFFGLALTSIIALAILLYRVLSCFGKAQKQYQKTLVFKSAYKSFRQTVDQAQAQVESWSGRTKITPSKGIELCDIDFTYEGHNKVLDNLSMNMEFGQFTVLIGPSGGGKSTLVDLIIGLQKPLSGQVKIDGIDLQEIDLHSWRQNISYVPQENILLHETIFNNMLLGDTQPTEAEALKALEAVGAMSFINQMEKGIHTVIGERGLSLSGGQRQKIMIAGALMHKPKLLILDEAMSALDAKSEQIICDYLRGLKDIAILLVSHRHSMLHLADKAYSIDQKQAHFVQLDENKNVI